MTNDLNGVFVGFHPNFSIALLGSPNNCSTSVGLKYWGSTSIKTLSVELPLNDVAKRKAILEKLNFNVDNAVRNKELIK